MEGEVRNRGGKHSVFRHTQANITLCRWRHQEHSYRQVGWWQGSGAFMAFRHTPATKHCAGDGARSAAALNKDG